RGPRSLGRPRREWRPSGATVWSAPQRERQTMTSTDYQEAHHQGAVDRLLAPRVDGPAPKPISSDRLLGSLKEAASWPGADRNTVVTLALSLVAARADAEGSGYFQDLSERDPANATAQALAGFFQVRVGHDLASAISKL